MYSSIFSKLETFGFWIFCDDVIVFAFLDDDIVPWEPIQRTDFVVQVFIGN